MRWTKTTLRNSFFGWVSPAGIPVVNPEIRMEEIRHTMLLELTVQDDTQLLDLERRLQMATDIQTLWYARSELMQVVSHRLGEAAAKDHLDRITRMFDGLVPASISCRPRQR